jgi:hypothetical protein
MDDNSSDDQADFRHAQTQAGLCFLCLATCVAYVMKQNTTLAASDRVGGYQQVVGCRSLMVDR